MKIKNIAFYLCALLCSIFILNACSEDLAEMDKGKDMLTLTVDKEVVALKENDAALTALTLKWTSGTNYGTGARLKYRLALHEKGNTEPAEALFDKVFNDQELAYSFTVRELNSYLHDAGISLKYGETLDVEATVSAEVIGYEEVYEQSSSVAFKVTTYEPVSESLYICGEATEGGWNAERMGMLSLVDNQQPGIFYIITTLTEGKEFKFFTRMDLSSPAYVCAPGKEQILSDGMTTSIIKKVDDSVDDLKFEVTETGTYKLTVDLLDNTLNVVKSEPLAPAFTTLYFVGSFTGWAFKPMKQDPVNPFIFLYSDLFEWNPDGEFKFGTLDGSWDNMYMATQDKAPYTDTNVKLGGTDQKWVLKEEECGKVYKIRLDITAGKEKMEMSPFEPYPTVSLVGDATPAGWNLPSSVSMEKIDEYTYQWTGNLEPGEIKFTCDNQSDWMGAWFMSVENGLTLETGEYDVYWVDKTNPDYGYDSLDNKWVVTDSGNYTITLNQATEKLFVQKN